MLFIQPDGTYHRAKFWWWFVSIESVSLKFVQSENLQSEQQASHPLVNLCNPS